MLYTLSATMKSSREVWKYFYSLFLGGGGGGGGVCRPSSGAGLGAPMI